MKAVRITLAVIALFSGHRDLVSADEEPDIDEGSIPDDAVTTHTGKENFSTTESGECIRIEESPLPDDDILFHFRQSDKRLNPNHFVKVVFKIISGYNLEFVKKVTLDYNPQVKSEIGPYPMKTIVSTVEDGVTHDQCYEIIITVHDTNECEYDGGDPDWVHSCDASTKCVNTEGSYFCACKDGEFAVPGTGSGKCQFETSSRNCCGDNDAECRSDFKCHGDSCASNTCHQHAVCVPGETPNTFSCECESGFKDVGKHTGLHPPGHLCEPQDHCAPNKCPNGCTCVSVTNSTTDGYFCPPVHGRITYHPANDDEWEVKPIHDDLRLDPQPHLCVDQAKPPKLVIEGEDPTVLELGQTYVERGVEIKDEDTGDLKRRFETDYSGARDLMHKSGFLKKCGNSTITYSLATPWIKERPTQTATRSVYVVDVDECTYSGDDDDFKHKCVGSASCLNLQCDAKGFSTVGYDCACLDDGYEPDSVNGCTDKRPPVIECSMEGCELAKLFVFQGETAMLHYPDAADGNGGILVPTNTASSSEGVGKQWLQNVLQGLPPPVLKAFDMVPTSSGSPDEIVDLSDTIRKGSLDDYGDGVWVQGYTVVDAAGNEFEFKVKIKVVELTEELLLPLLTSSDLGEAMSQEAENPSFGGKLDSCKSATSSSESLPLPALPENTSSSALAVWIGGFVIASWVVFGVMARVLTALQCLVVPGSLRHSQSRFMAGMDTLLAVQSLGALNPTERAKIAGEKWASLCSS